MITFVLVVASAIGICGIARMLLAIHACYWFNNLHESVDNLEPWDCTRFHEIMDTPRPWYIKINCWLEEHHV